MPPRQIRPVRNLSGKVVPPGDKSISHRQALLGALGSGRSTLSHYSSGADCQSTLDCIAAMGAAYRREGEQVEIDGVGLQGLRAPEAQLDAGNSGSTIRMLSGILAAQTFSTAIGGDESLQRRPMRRVIEPLAQMGARIGSRDGRPPLEFTPAPGGLRAIRYALPVASAQVKSAILLAGLYADGETTVEEPQATRDHTELALTARGVVVKRRRGAISLHGPVRELPAQDSRIPGDISSAAFFLCAAAMFPEARVTIEGVSLNPTRTALLDLLRRMGARLEISAIEESGGELSGTLDAGGPAVATGFAGLMREPERFAGTEISGAETVALIDEIPVLAVLATAADGGIRFSNAGELRVKECDRIAAIVRNLHAMGAECEEFAEGLFVPGPQRLHGAEIQTFGDHRIAMAFSIAGLVAEGETLIDDPDCASISYPEFFSVLEQIAQR
jgi:3-phosphoshikimate 1-carboxyvinyltransferase